MRFATRSLALLVLLSLVPARAQDTWTEPFPGVQRLHRVTSDQNINVLEIDLCHAGISTRATAPGERGMRTSAFGNTVDAQVAINADYYDPGYVPRSLAGHNYEVWSDTEDEVGRTPVAFGDGLVEILPMGEANDPESWMREVISGWRTHVIDGEVQTYPSSSHCTNRHPRTVLGLNSTNTTLYLALIDGRAQPERVGMTCEELAELMVEMGAYNAVNLDGGGSSTMWLEEQGIVNFPSGSSERVVANHLALHSGFPTGPSHCAVLPSVPSSEPATGDSLFSIYDPISVYFTREMEPVSTENAFSLELDGTAVSGTYAWTNSHTRLDFTPDTTLDTLTTYDLEIAGTAEGAAGDPFDGNGDGKGGDPFTMSFTTGYTDVEPPGIVAANPPSSALDWELRPVITVTYDERVLHESLEGIAHLLRNSDEEEVPTTLAVYDVGNQSVFSLFPQEDLDADTRYRVRVDPGVEDHFGNVRETEQLYTFRTGTQTYILTEVEDFESGVGDWWESLASEHTTGIVEDSTYRSADTDVFNQIAGGEMAMRTNYGWDTEASTTLIHVHLEDGDGPNPPGSPYQVVFDTTQVLQTYIFGDGENNQIRFAVEDQGPGGHEVSPWVEVDWKGWRLVSWDFTETGTWVGDGIVNPPLRFDSFQLQWNEPNGAVFGSVVFDDLRVVEVGTIGNERDDVAQTGGLLVQEPVPNPVSGTTDIRFYLGEPSDVSIAVYDVLGRQVARLLDREPLSAGEHGVSWNTFELSAGMYVIHVRTASRSETVKALVMR